MWALDFLGLDTSADEKAIKRAYAKLLKATRPDDDPNAFQKLNEAYQAALVWQKNNSLLEDDDDDIYKEPAKNPTPYTEDYEPDSPNNEAPLTESPPSLHWLYKQSMKIIAKNESHQLKYWFTDNSLLIDIEPQAVAQLFLNNWQKYLPPISIECFVVVDELFQLNNNELGVRLNAIWESQQQPTESSKLSHSNNKRERVNTHISIEDTPAEKKPELYLFYKQCMQIIVKNNPDELKNWLTDNVFLSDVEQQTITALFLNHWQKYLPPVSVECFEVIDELFQLNNIELQNTLNIIWQSKQQVPIDHEITAFSAVDIDALCQQCINVARQNTPDTLRLWLNTQLQLWSIDNKQLFQESLITSLLETPIGIQKNCFSVILDFFDLNRVQDSLDYETIDNLQSLLHGLWLLEPQHTANLKNKYKPIARFSSLKPDIENNWQLLEQLQKSFFWPQAFLASFPTSRAKQWGHSLRQLLDDIDNQTPDTICKKQLKFWLSFDQKGLHTTKLIRWTVINLILLLLTACPVMLCVAYFSNKVPTSLFNALSTGISMYAIPFFIVAAINLTVLIAIWYYLWIRIPYYAIKNPDLRCITIALTPCLCAISAILFLNNSQYSLVFLLLALFNSAINFGRNYDDEETTKENTSYVKKILYTIFVIFVVLFVIVFRSPLFYCILGYIGIRIAYNLYKSNIFQGADINILAIIDIGSISNLIYWICLITSFAIWLGAYETQKTKHKQTLSS